MLIIAGHIRTSPDAVEELARTLRSLVPATLAEDGCFAYHFAIDDPAEGTILVYELWRDQAALDAHLAMPAIGELLGGWSDRITIEAQKFDAANPRSPLE